MATGKTVKNAPAAFAASPHAGEAKAADSVMHLQKTTGAGVRAPSVLQLTLLTGGSGCGKSTLARAMLVHEPGPRVLMLTEDPQYIVDDDRLCTHVRDLARHDFVTVERLNDLAHASLPTHATVVVDCLCNLLSNLIFSADRLPQDARLLADAMLDDIRALARRCRMLIVITNEIGCEGNTGDKAGTEALYCTALSLANNALAREAGQVLEVVCGIPLPLTR